jgi:anti-sigma-K factor RskA
MTVEERRRIALHRAAAGTWGEEVADTLVELVAPSGHEFATRADVLGFERRMDERFATMDARWDERFAAMDVRWEERFAAMDERLTAMDERWGIRLGSLEHRLTATFERRIADAVTTQTRTLVFSQLAALVVIAGLAFGLR